MSSPGYNDRVTRFDFKRGDAAELVLGFYESTAQVVLSGSVQMQVMLKEAGKYDGAAVVSSSDWTLPVDPALDYRCSPNFNTVELDALLNSGDADEQNDEAYVDLMMEITWSVDAGVTWTSSDTVTARVYNDVIKGGEGVPVSGSPAYPKAQSVIDHLADTSNPHGVTAAQVGLGSVDNTSDADKPVSTAQQAALNGKLDVDASGDVLVTRDLAVTGDAAFGAGVTVVDGDETNPQAILPVNQVRKLHVAPESIFRYFPASSQSGSSGTGSTPAATTYPSNVFSLNVPAAGDSAHYVLNNRFFGGDSSGASTRFDLNSPVVGWEWQRSLQGGKDFSVFVGIGVQDTQSTKLQPETSGGAGDGDRGVQLEIKRTSGGSDTATIHQGDGTSVVSSVAADFTSARPSLSIIDYYRVTVDKVSGVIAFQHRKSNSPEWNTVVSTSLLPALTSNYGGGYDCFVVSAEATGGGTPPTYLPDFVQIYSAALMD